MARVLKIACSLMGVLLLIMVGGMGVGRYGKEGPKLILFTYLDGNQPMLGWVTTDFQHMRPLGRLCGTRWYPTAIAKPDENWLYVNDCSGQSRIGWAVKRIHIISGAEDVIATRMVPYSGSWSPDNRWFVFQERKNHQDDDDYEVEWVRVGPDGSQRLALTATIPIEFDYSEESWPTFSADGNWVNVWRHLWGPPHEEDIYRIRIDGKEWENLTANVDDLNAWFDAKASGLETNVSHQMIETALDVKESTPISSLVCQRGDGNWVVGELPSKHLRIINVEYSRVRGISTLDGSILWEVPNRDVVWVSPDEEWVYLGQEYRIIYDVIRWDGSDHHAIETGFGMASKVWSNDGQWLVFSTFDVYLQQYEINRMTPDGHLAEILITSPLKLETLGKSLDGHLFYFTVDDYSTNTFAFYTMRFDGSGLTRIKVLDPYNVDHIERFGPPINRAWQSPILAAIALTLITAPILMGRVGRPVRKVKI